MFRLITRISIILTLVLSIAALAMSVSLFKQRETLKGRTQKLEDAVMKVASTLEAEGGSNAMFAIASDQLKTFKAAPGGPPAMDEPLAQMVTAAQSQLVKLNNTRTELAETKDSLAKTKDELKNTQTQLASSQDKVKEQEGVIQAKNTIIAEKETAIGTLEREKTELAAKADAAKTQMEEVENEKRELADQVAAMEDKIAELEVKLFPELQKKVIPKGQQGVVAYVNPDWNFLIVRLAPESLKTTTPDLELLLYRVDKLIGKVRVVSIVDNLAVAEIINDWQQAVPQNNDGVLY